MAELLRHPRAVDVLVDLYDVCSTSQRNSMVAEMYGKVRQEGGGEGGEGLGEGDDMT